MSLDSLEGLFVNELKDIYNAEKQLIKALPRMAKGAGSPQLQAAFKKQMIKAVPNSSLDDAQAFDRAEMAYWKKVTDQVKVELPDN